MTRSTSVPEELIWSSSDHQNTTYDESSLRLLYLEEFAFSTKEECREKNKLLPQEVARKWKMVSCVTHKTEPVLKTGSDPGIVKVPSSEIRIH